MIGALRVTLPDRYRWYGEWSPRLARQIKASIDAATLRSHLEVQLRSTLYKQFYLRGRATPAGRPSQYTPVPNESPFVRALIEANQGVGSWQPGWNVVETGEDGVWASRAGLTVRVGAQDYRSEELSPVGTGSQVSVRMPKGFRTQSPGFYLAQSDDPFEPSPDDTIVRLYWHLAPSGAPVLMELLTTALNDARLPFRFKVLNDPNAYRRNDAGVLYISRTHLHQAAEHLRAIYRDIGSQLLPGIPALTKPIVPGLGLAENPRDTDSSYGMHRCGLLAEAFIESAERSVTNLDGVLTIVEERFRREGLDLRLPYLNPGSGNDYDSILGLDHGYVSAAPSSLQVMRAYGEDTLSEDSEPSGSWLRIATTIGERLVRDAIGHDSRCTWLGKLATETNRSEPSQAAVFGTIGSDVYSGTAGVALFLAELYSETRDQRFAETARAAIAQAVRNIDNVPGHGRLGLYSGWPGIALTSVRLGDLLGDDELSLKIPRSLFETLDSSPRPDEPDLLAGTAGAILAFLVLARVTYDERYLSRAIEFGDMLLTTAMRRRRTMSWPVDTLTGHRALTGFAHGAAGIATALLALFAETRLDRFAEAAHAAFAFERRHFSPSLGNWLDLRYPIVGSRFGPAAIVANAWCHGSAGIAISRLFAWRILGDRAFLDQAETAIRATRRWIETEARNSPERWTLCHGFPGNADVISWSERWLSDSPDFAVESCRLANAVGRAGAGIISTADGIVGATRADDPGLMLGLAGLGFFYLRLANPSISSPLVPLALDPS